MVVSLDLFTEPYRKIDHRRASLPGGSNTRQ
jgi:hypothetical protein